MSVMRESLILFAEGKIYVTFNFEKLRFQSLSLSLFLRFPRVFFFCEPQSPKGFQRAGLHC